MNKKYIDKKKTDTGYSLLLYLCINALFTFFYSLLYMNNEAITENVYRTIFLFTTILLNPFYIFLFLFILYYPLYKIFPKVIFLPFLFLTTGIYYTYLFIEKLVFNQFKFHINSFVLKVLQQDGALQVLGIGSLEVFLAVILILVGSLFSWVLFFLITRSYLNYYLSKVLNGFLRKFIFVVVIISLFLTDKTIYAWYLYNQQPTIYILTKRIPLYIPAQGGKVFDQLGFQPAKVEQPQINFSKSQVKYPLKPYQSSIKNKSNLPNIIILMADALRPDMVTKKIMPNTYEFKSNYTTNFERHYSGSNGTSQGLFTLFYGLPSSYMDYFSKAEVSPVFFDVLIQNDYKIKLISSKSLGWLGTDQVVFFKIREHIVDELDRDSIKSDMLVTELAAKELENHKAGSERPLFLFVFYDSTHLPNFYHDDYKIFKPDKTSPIFNPSSKEDRLRGFNQYKNASYFIDVQFHRLLEKLRDNGYLKNSIIYITSDHGSEKYEKGHWGHASAFTNEQLLVPSLLYFPGYENRDIHRITSHSDVIVTFMELMGETYKKEYHSLGQSLFDETPRDYIIADGLANRVLIDDKYKIDYTPFEGISYYKVTDSEDNPVDNPDEIISQYTPKILNLFKDLQVFLK